MGTTRLFRRRFISPVAAAGGAALTAPKSPAVPCKVVMKGAAQSLASGPHPPAVSVAIPSNHADGVGRPSRAVLGQGLWSSARMAAFTNGKSSTPMAGRKVQIMSSCALI
jgi:hypothetical protein